ncbi:putative Trafficking protein particle complex subunit [Paratrimastix pyriformis]|uniref:Trafficking protein particle complex subunit 2-like protein n=1 Tax=Paratrimastix pyriformis TaxID=342808 RepID=A0ABQ8UP46_9EUKA|nr:putative Trafficking protein particle complex subunit [Paratrimastix pyriformis]
MINCVAVVGKSNAPLFLKTYHVPETLKFHYTVHTSLDVVEEKCTIRAPSSTVSTPQDMYLGLLYPTEEFRIYGYITATKTKFIVVTDDVDVRSPLMEQFCKNLHTLYVNMVCNPFYAIEQEQKIESPVFIRQVEQLVQRFNEGSR